MTSTNIAAPCDQCDMIIYEYITLFLSLMRFSLDVTPEGVEVAPPDAEHNIFNIWRHLLDENEKIAKARLAAVQVFIIVIVIVRVIVIVIVIVIVRVNGIAIIIKILIAGLPRPDLRGREEPQEWEELARKEIPGPAERCAEGRPAVCFRSK